MIKGVALCAMMLSACGGVASAKTYNISFDGYCDAVSFTVDKGVIVGASNGFNASLGVGCDDGYLVGSLLTLRKSVAPGGQIAALASDLGDELYGGQFLYYINLTNHTWVLYQGFNGVDAQYALVGTWSLIKDTSPKDAAHARGLPSLVSVLHRQAAMAASSKPGIGATP